MSNFLDIKSTIDISKINDENFLKELSKKFYQIINTNDFDMYKYILSRWIMKSNKHDKTILKLMQIHNESDSWFSSIIGFFYQYGMGCEVDKNKSLKLYLLAINNNINLHLLDENDNEFDILQNINIIIGKYLLSLFY